MGWTWIVALVVLVAWFMWRGKSLYGARGKPARYAELERRALLGEEAAQYEIAACYYTEEDERYLPRIFRWVLLVAEKGEDPSMMLLAGDLYLSGKGTAPDAAAALHWYERALSADIMLGERTDLPKEAHDYLEAQVLALRRETEVARNS